VGRHSYQVSFLSFVSWFCSYTFVSDALLWLDLCTVLFRTLVWPCQLDSWSTLLCTFLCDTTSVKAPVKKRQKKCFGPLEVPFSSAGSVPFLALCLWHLPPRESSTQSLLHFWGLSHLVSKRRLCLPVAALDLLMHCCFSLTDAIYQFS